jgi:hypothetical protein
MNQNELLALLRDSRRAGIYHLPLSGRTAVKKLAADAGFAFFEVSFGDADRIDGVLSRIGNDLDFPKWYGRNLDALKDCLTDFSWCEAPGYILSISRAEILHAEDPAAFHTLNEVFAAAIAEWRSQDVPMWVFYDLRADGLATLRTVA